MATVRGHLFLIADGMGGHKGGEVASALTVTTVEHFMLDVFRRAEDFQTALKQAHARIMEETASHPEVSGMGTTLTMAVANNWKLFVVHAGDSRCYLFRGGELRQLTTDHTFVGEMVRGGILRPAEAARHHVPPRGYQRGGRVPGQRQGGGSGGRSATRGRCLVVYGRPDRHACPTIGLPPSFKPSATLNWPVTVWLMRPWNKVVGIISRPL